MANEKEIIDQVKVSVEGLTTAFVGLSDVLTRNFADQKNLIKNLNDIKAAIGSSKELKEFISLQTKMSTTQKDLSKTQLAALDMAKKEEQVKQQAIKTQTAAIIAAEKEVQAKMKTARESERAKKASEDASRAYNVESKRLLELTKAAKDAAVQYGVNSKEAKKLRNEQQLLDKKIKDVDASLGIHNRNVGNYGKAMGGLKNILGAFGVAGALSIVARTMKQAFDITRDYEKKNAELAGVLGLTLKETKRLQKESQRLGATTAFTASEVTILQTELSRMGKTEAEILAMTEGVITATIAMGSEIGATATLITATLNAYQLGAGESARVSDILTLSTQRSALSFEKLETMLPIVAGAAAAVGYSLEETVAMLGQTADRGIDASTGATALRNIFIQLAAKGITLDEALQQINASQNKLTTANQLFGDRASVTALALAETTAKTKEMTAALKDAAGTSDAVAKTQLDTLDGSIRLLTSAWEGLILSMSNSETVLGRLANGVVKFITNAINGITTLGGRFDMMLNSAEKWSDTTKEQIIQYATFDSTGKMVGETLDSLVKVYDKLNPEVQANISLNQFLFEKMIKMGESVDYARVIADFYTKQLEEMGSATTTTAFKQEVLTDAIKEVVNVTTDLIKIQEELLVKAQEMDGSTEAEIFARNKKIKSIEEEIKRLKALGDTTKDVVDIIKNDIKLITEEQSADFRKLKEGDTEVMKAEAEKQLDIVKEYAEKEKEVKREKDQATLDFFNEAGNAAFESRAEAYNKDIEKNNAYYDKLLANELLDQEQRDLLEAQKEKKNNEIEAKKRNLEKKQFLFSQAFKIIDIIGSIARANAAALVYGPILAPGIIAQNKIIGALQIGTILAQSLPKFAKGTDNAPGGAAIVGERGTELVVEPSGKAWLTDSKDQVAWLEKGSKVITNDELRHAVSNYTTSQIINNNPQKAYDTGLAKLVAKMVIEQQKGSSKIVDAINRNKQKPANQIDQIRTQRLRNKLSN